MTCAYYSAISEAKIKKRQAPDPNLGKRDSGQCFIYFTIGSSNNRDLHPLRTQHPSTMTMEKAPRAAGSQQALLISPGCTLSQIGTGTAVEVPVRPLSSLVWVEATSDWLPCVLLL